MFYIVGLGNPGIKYARTRHNIGWSVLDAFISHAELPLPVERKKYPGRLSEGIASGESVKILYPETFMNNSGLAVEQLVPAGESEQLIVVHDDVDLPVGQFRLSYGSGSGGHNGIASIIEVLGTKDFVRLRVGVGKAPSESSTLTRPSSEDLADYVLEKISSAEALQYETLFPTLIDAIIAVMIEGRDKAMNLFNQVK